VSVIALFHSLLFNLVVGALFAGAYWLVMQDSPSLLLSSAVMMLVSVTTATRFERRRLREQKMLNESFSRPPLGES